MAILKSVDPPGGKFCLCFPPIYFMVGIGTIWQCDACGRVFERVAGSPAWKRISYPKEQE